MLPALQTHATSWTPAAEGFRVTLNLALDGCIVPTLSGGARVDYSRLVVLDGLIDDATRQQLLDFLTEPGWAGAAPPDSNWERCTADAAGKPRTWGLKADRLQELASSQLPAKLEIQSRLSLLYPEALIAHMPSEQIQAADDTHQEQQEQQEQEAAEQPAMDCSCFLANAAVHGDAFSWHVDADPSTFPAASPWARAHGTYCNREPGQPLFVSLLLYLDAAWPLDSNAETLFLDSGSDTGVLVRPRPGRAVLFDQDVTHRLTQPSPSAGAPRYSLVMKLVMVPRQPGSSCCIARPEWGPPAYFGSAGAVRAAAAAAAAAGGGGGGGRARKKRAMAGGAEDDDGTVGRQQQPHQLG